jgi:AbiJ N-terminal domain 4
MILNISDVYSKRQKRLRGELPDVYQYEDIPAPLRVQIVHILNDAVAINADKLYSSLHNLLCREYGVFDLANNSFHNPLLTVLIDKNALAPTLVPQDYVEITLDIIEIIFRAIDIYVRSDYYLFSPKISPDSAIEELNFRFKEHGVGFEYRSGQIIRIDSELVHAEVVKPVLNLLSDSRFQGANEEFLKAYEHYRHGRYKECLNECLKSFESTLKTICDIRQWTYNQNDTSKKLIDICLKEQLVPQYLQSQFAAIRTILESGVPTIRNKLGGHGQGTQQITVSQNMASYMLHLTATNLLFIIEAEKDLP